jgi:ABC-2 type transport system ATP-binding protein
MNDCLISCARLSKSIDGERIVKDISFSIKEGEILGLIGPSGAGKSTIFKILTMMEKRDSGEVVLDGISIDGYRKQYDRAESLDIGFVFQEDVLWEEKTVDQNLQLVGEFRGLKGEALENRMRIIKRILILDDVSKKLVKHISGGSKRKLCCAMALLIPPRILFLDEISNGVDPVAR